MLNPQKADVARRVVWLKPQGMLTFREPLPDVELKLAIPVKVATFPKRRVASLRRQPSELIIPQVWK